MPKVNEHPEKLRPYIFHGVDLSWTASSEEATGDCPWCGRDGKFTINIRSGQWRCFGCNEGAESDKPIKGGNAQVFLDMLWQKSDAATAPADYRTLADARGLLYSDTLVGWGVVKSIITGNWLLPGYNIDGSLSTLYHYVKSQGKRILLATTSFKHGLFGVPLFDKAKSVVYLCEGPWDGAAWWEILGQAKETEQGLRQTGNREASLLADANVLAVPGCTTFLESWIPLFADKIVILMYDNDHPSKHPKTGQVTPPAAMTGMESVARALSGSATPPAELHYLRWAEVGYDQSLPHGHDLRDCLING